MLLERTRLRSIIIVILADVTQKEFATLFTNNREYYVIFNNCEYPSIFVGRLLRRMLPTTMKLSRNDED